MVRLQGPVPLQAPPQPWKLQPLAGVAVRVTGVPALKLALQLAPQSIPAGVLVSLPWPPATYTASVYVIWVKLAVTLSAASMVRLQVPVPLHAPPQPWKSQPLAGAAVRVTGVPELKLALQVAPQSIPAGELVTLPWPPAMETARV